MAWAPPPLHRHYTFNIEPSCGAHHIIQNSEADKDKLRTYTKDLPSGGGNDSITTNPRPQFDARRLGLLRPRPPVVHSLYIFSPKTTIDQRIHDAERFRLHGFVKRGGARDFFQYVATRRATHARKEAISESRRYNTYIWSRPNVIPSFLR